MALSDNFCRCQACLTACMPAAGEIPPDGFVLLSVAVAFFCCCRDPSWLVHQQLVQLSPPWPDGPKGDNQHSGGSLQRYFLKASVHQAKRRESVEIKLCPIDGESIDKCSVRIRWPWRINWEFVIESGGKQVNIKGVPKVWQFLKCVIV